MVMGSVEDEHCISTVHCHSWSQHHYVIGWARIYHLWDSRVRIQEPHWRISHRATVGVTRQNGSSFWNLHVNVQYLDAIDSLPLAGAQTVNFKVNTALNSMTHVTLVWCVWTLDAVSKFWFSDIGRMFVSVFPLESMYSSPQRNNCRVRHQPRTRFYHNSQRT